MDLITLDLVYVLPEDEGLYTCEAVSDFGQAATSATIKVQAIDALLLDTQHDASWQRIQEIEAPKPLPEEAPEREKEPPRFIINLSQVPDLQEGQSAMISGKVEPAWDNELVIEFYKDGQPLQVDFNFSYLIYYIFIVRKPFPYSIRPWKRLSQHSLRFRC
jgi:hypothetical protein